MSVYVDPLRDYGWSLGRSCHMIADTDKELHEMADKIGMKRVWFQAPGKYGIPHYDLVESRRIKAIINGAKQVDFKTIIAMRENYRKNKKINNA